MCIFISMMRKYVRITNRILAMSLAVLLLSEGAFSNVALAAEPEPDIYDEIVILTDEIEDEDEAETETGDGSEGETGSGLGAENGDGTGTGDDGVFDNETVPGGETELGDETLPAEGEGDEVVSARNETEKSYDIKVLLTSGEGEFELDETAYYDEDENVLIHADKAGSFSDYIRFEDTDSDGTSEEITCTELIKPRREGYSFIGYYVIETEDFTNESEVSSEYLVTEDTLIKDLLDRQDLTCSEEDEEVIVLFPVWLADEAEPEPEDEEPETLDDDSADDLEEQGESEPHEDEEVGEDDEEDEDEEVTDPENSSLEDEAKETALNLEVTGLEGGDLGILSEEELAASLAVTGVGDETLLTGLFGDPEEEDEKDGFWIEGIEDKPYTGANITFQNLVVHHDTKTVDPSNYSVAYKNNKNAGTATVTITFKNNYSGKITKDFTIARADFQIEEDTSEEGALYSFNIQKIELPYNGKAQKPAPIVTFSSPAGTFTLKNGTDYTLTYPGEGDPATDYVGTEEGGQSYPVNITGKGNFEGTATTYVTILKRDLISIDKAKVTIVAEAVDYGEGNFAAEPVVTLIYGKGAPLTGVLESEYDSLPEDEKSGYQYYYTYHNDGDLLTGEVEITATGDGDTKFYGSRTVSYKVSGTSIAKAKVDTSVVVYDGTAKTKDLVLDGVTLTENTQYRVNYKNDNNVNAGTVTATYTGINGYTGTVTKSFKIAPYDIKPKDTGDKITVGFRDDNAVFNYVKGGVKPEVVVTFEDGEGNYRILDKDHDYTLSYSNNTVAQNATRMPTVTIRGKGNFTGARTVNITIDKQDIGSNDISLVAADKVFVNKRGNFTTTVTVTDSDGKKLVAVTDYKKEFKYFYTADTKLVDGDYRQAGDAVEENDAVPAGTTLRVEITGNGNYQGTKDATFRLTGADISKASVRVYTQYYDGEQVQPDYSQIEVKLGGVILNGGEDYVIDSYGPNDKKGSGTLTIRGIGDYGGTKEVKFAIQVKSTNFTVVFNGNGSTSGNMSNMTVSAVGKPVTLTPNKFIRTGYEFKGWKLTQSGIAADYADKDEITNSGVVSGRTVVLYAHWESKEFTATYHLNGWTDNESWIAAEGVTGSGPLYSKTFSADSATFILNVPEKEKWPTGYQFGGWYLDSSYKTRISKVKKGTVNNLDIYAKWVPYTYTVKFDGNGGEGTMHDEVFSYGIPKALSANTFKKAGYKFAGWSKDEAIPDDTPAEYSKADYADKQVVSDIADNADNHNESVTLYAIWRNDFNIEYLDNGAAIDEVELNAYRVYTSGIGLSNLPVLVRDGYSFGGWYSDAALKKRVKSIGKNVSGDMTLYAKWNPNKYTIVFKGGEGATGRTANVSFSFGDAVTLPDSSFAKKGYEFKGWSLAENAGTPSYVALRAVEAEDLLSDAGIEKTQNNQTINLYAVWEQWQAAEPDRVGQRYTVTFVGGEGATGRMSAQKLVYGTGKKLTKNAFKRKGYTFMGWNPEGTSDIIADGAFVYSVGNAYPQSGNITLYALWEKDTYTIAYNNADGVDNSSNPVAYTVLGDAWTDEEKTNIYPKNDDGSLAINDVSTVGRTFLGWFENARLSGKAVKSIASGSTGDKSFYAKWQNTQYTINYNLNAGDDSSARLDKDKAGYFTNYKDLYDGGYILATASRDGYGFGGWYSDAACRKYVGYSITNPNSDITLYAKWVPHAYTIKFLKNNDAATGTMKDMESVKVGSRPNLIANGFKSSAYDFEGWVIVTVSDPVNPEGSIVEDIREEDIDYRDRQKLSSDLSTTDDDVIYLAAKWKVKEFTIQYLENNGKAIAGMTPVKYSYESEDINPVFENAGEDNLERNPEKERFTFEGWFKDKKLTQAAGNPVIPHHSTGNKVFYAKWRNNMYTVRFLSNADDAEGDMADMSDLKTGSDYRLSANAFTRPGFEFDGWVMVGDPDNIEGSIVLDENGSPLTFTDKQQIKDLSLTDGAVIYLAAQWKIRPYTITYLDPDDRKIAGVTPTSYTYGTEIETLPTGVSTARYTIEGWYMDKDLSVPVGTPAISRFTTGDITFYAKCHYSYEDLPENDNCFNVTDYGAIPDDGVEDNEDINWAIYMASRSASAGNRATVYFPPGEYTITCNHRHSIKLLSYVDLKLDPGAVLNCTKRSESNLGYGILGANDVHDILISGGKLIGGRSFYSKDEYGHGVNILGSYNITVANMEICDNWGDGVYIGCTNGEGCSDISIINCNIHYNRRNNVTITYGDRIYIDGCTITNAQGTPPQAGICVEPNDDSFHVCDDIYIKNTVLTAAQRDNWQFRSYHAYNGRNKTIATNVVFDNCRITGWFSNWYQPKPKFINDTKLDGYYDPGA